MRFPLIALAALACLPACADSQFRVRQMTRGDVPSGKGQCDIRLQVDGEIEVSVRGDTVFLRTLSGREARDDGSECNLPLPGREMRGFEFKVTESRNQIRLGEEPARENRFAAIVRIRDSAGGYGRYCFRLSWNAADGPGPAPHVLDGPAPTPDDRRGGGGDGFAWNNATHYGGRGTGSAAYNGEEPRALGAVSLDIDRGGHAAIAFETVRGRAMMLRGTVIAREGDRLRIDAVAAEGRLHGTVSVTVDSPTQTVRFIELEATDGADRLRVHWEALAVRGRGRE